MSTPIGEHDYCRYLELATKPDGYRKIGTIPLATRTNIRHQLEGLRHQVGDLRNAMTRTELNADGAVTDVERMIRALRHIKRELGGTE